MPAEPASTQHDRRWLILGIIGIAQLMVVLDATIVNIALPSAQKALGFSSDNRQWIVTAYALAFGSLLLLGGRLGDLFGRKWTFIGGLIGFSVASAIGGFAGSFAVLVGARALQGVFGAVLAPSALGLLTVTFTAPDERNKAFGIFGAIAGGGSAVGLLLGGILTEYLTWRWCLFVNLAFALPAAAAAFTLLDNTHPKEAPHIDLPGTVTASAGLFSLVYGFANAETHSWTAGLTLFCFGAFLVLLTAFLAIQRRAAHPLLPLRIVMDRNRGGAYLAIAVAGIGIFGAFLFLTYYLQSVRGFSPVKTGLAFLPMTACIIVTATTVQTKVVSRTGAKPLVPVGMVLAALAMLFFTKLGVTSSYAPDVLPGLMVMGVGLGLTFAPCFATATLGVRPSDAGVASAMVNTSQQVGGSVGTALLSTLALSATTSFAEGKTPSAGLAAQAAVHGYTTAFTWSAAIFAGGAVLCGLILRPGAPQAVGQVGAEPALAH